MLRPDDTTFHTFYWDPTTGEPLRGATAQGAHDGSCWARGQAWGIYGFALNYRATGDARVPGCGARAAPTTSSRTCPPTASPTGTSSTPTAATHRATARPRPSPRPASSSSHSPRPTPTHAERATEAADRILDSLIAGYTPGATASRTRCSCTACTTCPRAIGVDEGTLWGDYFYLEALMRTVDPEWRLYW